MMIVLDRIKWLLPVLLIGLAVVAIELPTWTPGRVLADGPPASDELQAQEDNGPLAVPPLAEMLAEEPATSLASAQFDDSTHGTY